MRAYRIVVLVFIIIGILAVIAVAVWAFLFTFRHRLFAEGIDVGPMIDLVLTVV